LNAILNCNSDLKEKPNQKLGGENKKHHHQNGGGIDTNTSNLGKEEILPSPYTD
jgi:hypothetical protein